VLPDAGPAVSPAAEAVTGGTLGGGGTAGIVGTGEAGILGGEPMPGWPGAGPTGPDAAIATGGAGAGEAGGAARPAVSGIGPFAAGVVVAEAVVDVGTGAAAMSIVGGAKAGASLAVEPTCADGPF